MGKKGSGKNSKGNKSKGKKSKGKKGSGGDDGCIGNRRVRTIILAIILCISFVFAFPYAQAMEESHRDLADTVGSIVACDYCEDAANAWAFIMAGCAVSIVGCVCAVLLFFIPNYNDKLSQVAGFVLIVGGIVYLIGIIWWIALQPDAAPTYDLQKQLNAQKAAFFGEALLAGGSMILLGLDALLQIYENEAYRLASNLGIILAVSILCINAYFLQICEEDSDALIPVPCATPDGVEAIATGYLVLFCTTLVYIILYICTCITYDWKDKCIIRVILAVCLVIGGVLCAIGYYVYSGSGFDQDTDTDGLGAKRIVCYVGYTVLIAGLCIVWALDIALDDVKNN